MTKTEQLLHELGEGPGTSTELALVMGMTTKECCAFLNYLARLGKARPANKVNKFGARIPGPAPRLWELVS
jgi:hypothetical protein